MKFEHLVEINNSRHLQLEPLSRLQLWRGLVLRAEKPHLFMQQLDSCTILDRSMNTISRCLKFGELIVYDHVHFSFPERISFHIPAQNEIFKSALEISIEEPEPDRFFIRFTYEDSSPDEGPDAIYNDYRKSAYREADIDTIRTIRQMSAEGRFNDPLTEDEETG